MTTVHKHLHDIPFMTKERAEEIELQPDEDIDYSEIPPLDEDFFREAKCVKRPLDKQKNFSSSNYHQDS